MKATLSGNAPAAQHEVAQEPSQPDQDRAMQRTTHKLHPAVCLVHDHDSPPERSRAGGTPPPIGGRLRQVRQARSLTLGAVESASGISKSMLSQIERGKVNPTFATLWHLTQSLGIGIGELLGEVHSTPGEVRSYEHIKVYSTPVITTADGLCATKILSPRHYALPIEWYEITYRPGGALRANAHGNGEWEHMTLVSGRVMVEIGDEEVVLEPGETIRYSADQPHGARNIHDGESKLLLVVVPTRLLRALNLPHGPLDQE